MPAYTALRAVDDPVGDVGYVYAYAFVYWGVSRDCPGNGGKQSDDAGLRQSGAEQLPDRLRRLGKWTVSSAVLWKIADFNKSGAHASL